MAQLLAMVSHWGGAGGAGGADAAALAGPDPNHRLTP